MKDQRYLTPLTAGLGILAVITGLLVGSVRSGVAQPQPPNSAGPVLQVFGVGGVLTSDGTLWSYLPDRDRWMTIDEAFSLQGRETHVLPLPVPADTIAQISSFGFFLTRTGECWLYEMERDRWRKLPPPGR